MIFIQTPALVFPQVSSNANLYGEEITDTNPHYSLGALCEHLNERMFVISMIESLTAPAVPPNVSLWVEVSQDETFGWLPYPGRPGPSGQGDIDGDGTVTDNDLNILTRIIVGLYAPTVSQSRRADVNGDGSVNALDITALGLLQLGRYNPASYQSSVANPYCILGAPKVVVGTGVVNARQNIVLPFTAHAKYARLGIQAAAVVANGIWQVTAHFAGQG